MHRREGNNIYVSGATGARRGLMYDMVWSGILVVLIIELGRVNFV